MLEPLFPICEPSSDCFGGRGAIGMLFDAYRLLIHHALVTGIRRALELPALPAAPPRAAGELPVRAHPQDRAA
jgi:hypothetical protein